MVSKIDHKELAISRLATQFKESANLIQYIKTLLLEADTLEQVFLDLLENRWIDTAVGVNLDVLGSIVGQSREFIDAEIFDYFGFYNHPQAQSFGSLTTGEGGRFVYLGEPITGIRLLNDEEYRLFIKARIVRNYSSSTPENIISQIRYVFNSPLVFYSEIDSFDFDRFTDLFSFEGYAYPNSFGSLTDTMLGSPFSDLAIRNIFPYYRLDIGRVLSLNEKSILKDTDIIAKTAGVKVFYVSEFDSERFFGFINGSDGMGSVSNSDIGGKLGSLIFN